MSTSCAASSTCCTCAPSSRPGGGREGGPADLPDDVAVEAAEYREKLIESVVETDESLMERYLEGEEIGGAELGAALEAPSPAASSSR